MTDSSYDAFARPDADDLVTFRRLGPVLFATVTTPAISAVETPVVGEALRAAILEAGPDLRHLVVDLEAVGMINSMALGMLVTTYSTALHRDIAVVLMAVREPVLDLLNLTKLAKLLTICRTAEDLERALR